MGRTFSTLLRNVRTILRQQRTILILFVLHTLYGMWEVGTPKLQGIFSLSSRSEFFFFFSGTSELFKLSPVSFMF